MSSIKVDTSDLSKFSAEMKTWKLKTMKGTSEAIKVSTLAVKRGAMQNLTANGSVKTGQLRAAINTNIKEYEGEVKAATKYALGVEKGTRPHVIRPKKGKFLFWKGAKHPVKQVNHPGGKAKPYLIPALEKETPILLKRLEGLIKW